MKSYTDLEQSKRLADILPKGSADMEYILEHWIDEKTYHHKEGYCEIPVVKVDDDCPLQPITHPCWSLSALLAQMPCVELVSSNDGHYRAFWHEKYSGWHSNPVDACMELLNREHSAELHSCRQCAFCDWRNQYCGAKDADMGKAYMIAQKQCSYFEERKEEEK